MTPSHHGNAGKKGDAINATTTIIPTHRLCLEGSGGSWFAEASGLSLATGSVFVSAPVESTLDDNSARAAIDDDAAGVGADIGTETG